MKLVSIATAALLAAASAVGHAEDSASGLTKEADAVRMLEEVRYAAAGMCQANGFQWHVVEAERQKLYSQIKPQDIEAGKLWAEQEVNWANSYNHDNFCDALNRKVILAINHGAGYFFTTAVPQQPPQGSASPRQQEQAQPCPQGKHADAAYPDHCVDDGRHIVKLLPDGHSLACDNGYELYEGRCARFGQ
jgi:hypothetical protein